MDETYVLRKWRTGELTCATLLIAYWLLDNPQLTEPEALSIVERWNALDSGRRLHWLVGRVEAPSARMPAHVMKRRPWARNGVSAVDTAS